MVKDATGDDGGWAQFDDFEQSDAFGQGDPFANTESFWPSSGKPLTLTHTVVLHMHTRMSAQSHTRTHGCMHKSTHARHDHYFYLSNLSSQVAKLFQRLMDIFKK